MVRGWLLGAGLLALAVAGVLWALAGEDTAGPMELSERTDLIAMVCAVLGGVAVLATLWRRPEEDEAAAVARLARAVKSIGEPQWISSLGGDLKAIDVTFAFRPSAGARAAALPASPAGRLEQVVEDYRELRPRRMVITGEPGAGKTVLARKFVMKLIELRGADEPVPVLVAMADWDAGETFQDWLVRHLQHDYGLPPASARRVVAARMVLPVLDGLDEMDATGVVGGAPGDSRAARALDALARHQDGTDPAPLVLTCRSAEYDALETAGSHILDAARLEIAPVTPAQAREFLALRGARRPQLWQPLLDDLRDRPSGVLAGALATPWRLTLAAVAFDRDGDPGELLTAATEAEVADRLLARFIGASTANTSVGSGRYEPERIHRRLAALARAMSTSHGADTDLVLEHLAVRLNPRRGKALYLALCLWWAAVAGVSLVPGWTVFGGDRDLTLLVMASFLGAAAHSVGRVSRVMTVSRFSVPPLGSPMWRVGLRVSLSAQRGVILGMALILLVVLWVVAAPEGWGGLGLPFLALAGAGIVGLLCCTVALYESDLAAFGPSGWTRMGSATALAMVATGVILPGSAWAVPELRLAALLLVPATFWLLHMMMAGPWHLYYCGLLTHRPRLPLRLARFLDWSVSAGLMRTSGVAYQFRHREFQEWLVRHPAP
ncbi:NACHT domain-containing protein [Streptomyces sp. NPDC015130]|uniref:NACHT domain-containing protein n=1 Tax=Streptomyces sp. NPDC015130 TaxID=3364940 RepID=UPI0036FED900